VWASLSTCHTSLSEGNSLARRFARDVNVFASACDDSPAALAALASLVRSGESVYVLQVPEVVIPPGLVAIKESKGVQMVATRPFEAAGLVASRPLKAAGDDLLPLGESDAAEMLALARLTEPGPFLARTHTMGSFLGIRRNGRLAAMAGERMRFPGYTELSGVCTHPDFRGLGLARRLSCAVSAGIAARGEQAFLHAWKTNNAAISLYRSLGFEIRAEVNVAELAVAGR
jgi:predicted GNAT family acetyltransferase